MPVVEPPLPRLKSATIIAVVFFKEGIGSLIQVDSPPAVIRTLVPSHREVPASVSEDAVLLVLEKIFLYERFFTPRQAQGRPISPLQGKPDI
jgi:hypothetical protein